MSCVCSWRSQIDVDCKVERDSVHTTRLYCVLGFYLNVRLTFQSPTPAGDVRVKQVRYLLFNSI